MAARAKVKEKELFIDEFRKADGNISAVCRVIGISRFAFYAWLENDETFRERFEEAREELLDITEAKLMECIKGAPYVNAKGEDCQLPPNVLAIMFKLKTLGKHRGYVEGNTNQTSSTQVFILAPQGMISDERRKEISEGKGVQLPVAVEPPEKIPRKLRDQMTQEEGLKFLARFEGEMKGREVADLPEPEVPEEEIPPIEFPENENPES